MPHQRKSVEKLRRQGKKKHQNNEWALTEPLSTATTLSPVLKSSTPGPTATTSPAISRAVAMLR
jgi:hypothetical protein